MNGRAVVEQDNAKRSVLKFGNSDPPANSPIGLNFFPNRGANRTQNPFVHDYRPISTGLQRRLGLRPADAKPQWSEIGLHLVVWSIAAELIAPHLFSRATGDPWDVAAYAGGALLSGVIWRLE